MKIHLLNMIVYHGSNKSNLNNLLFIEENAEFINAYKDTYGTGIYLAESKELALGYASSSIYTVKINSNIFDNTSIKDLKNCLNEIEKYLKIPKDFFIKYELINSTITHISTGDLGQLFYQLNLIIDSDYDLYQEVLKYTGEDISDKIDLFEKEWLAKYPVYKYLDQDIGNIFVCYDHEGKCLEIIDEEVITED